MWFVKKEDVKDGNIAINVKNNKELIELISIFEASYYYMEQYDNDKLIRKFDISNGTVYRPTGIQNNDLYCYLEHADEEYYNTKNIKVIPFEKFRDEHCVYVMLRG